MARAHDEAQDSRLFAKSEFGSASDLTVSTFAQRPDLLSKVFGPEIQSAVPEFMRHDPTGGLYYRDEALEFFREFGLVAVDPADPGQPVARAFSVPFAFRDGTEGREELPGGGWDAVIRWADADRRAERHRTAVSALEIMVAPRLQRRGISRLMLAAMRDNARRLGFVDLYAPLRPTEKHLEPLTPFADYVARQRKDGLPYDSWIRTHVLAGARIVEVAPYSMVISGTIAEWTAWTGLPFGGSGPAIVPGALSPVHVSLEQVYAVYVEPNLWVHHRLA
jgi:GNAT superfamily N-acetyltransferase